ncbi:hypothetical protein HDV00_011952 [Rhizophlyctis rosea]|nr:hypothetical protein HDV00_011952 [Rhizophlyctis rosea]
MFSKFKERPFAPLLLLILLSAPPPSYASQGDRDPIYQSCLQQCTSTTCTPTPPPLPLPLLLTFWDCPQECAYNCMHQVTDDRIDSSRPVLQYYGKWPFHRLWGIQEPASVLFSILNGYAHYIGYRRLRLRIPNWYPLRPFMLINALLGINAWVWSAVFHTRDFPSTEKLDYFSAMASILFSTCYCIIRVFDLARTDTDRNAWRKSGAGFREHIGAGGSFLPFRTTPSITVLLTLALLFYSVHTTYLSIYQPFNYSYNMLASVVIGVASNLLWLIWGISQYSVRPYAWKIVACVLLITLAMSLELWDFPPIWGVFDAHSLWHAATVPLVYLYYDFLISDAVAEVRIGKGKMAVR